MKYYLLVALSVLNLIGFSQECDHIFLGELSDFHDKTPIIGATVFIQNLNKYFMF